MLRVKDAKQSLDFYQNVLGMELSASLVTDLLEKFELTQDPFVPHAVHESPGSDFTKCVDGRHGEEPMSTLWTDKLEPARPAPATSSPSPRRARRT